MKSVFQKYAHRIAVVLLVVMGIHVLGSCSKEISNGLTTTGGDKLSFTITGVVEETVVVPTSKTNKNSKLQAKESSLFSNGPAASLQDKQIIPLDGFDAVLTVEEGSYNDNLLQLGAVANVNNHGGLTAATKPLGANKKYRVIVFEAGTSNVVATEVGTSGTRLDVGVDKGKSYDWVIYSFNDTEDPGVSTTTLETDHRDLIYAKSIAPIVIGGAAGDGTDVNVPINVVLQHQLARVVVEVNAANFPGDIVALSAELGASNYFKRGTFNLKTGEISNPVAISTGPSMNFTSQNATNNQIKVSNFYTVATTQINPFAVNINSLTISTPAGNSSLSATRNFSFTKIVPELGKSITAKIEFLSLASYDCGAVTTKGTYTTETPLVAANNYIEVVVVINKAGNIRLATEDKNGMKFDSGLLSYSASETGSRTIKLLPVKSTTVLNDLDGLTAVVPNSSGSLERDSKPNTSEEGSANDITNKINNQRSSFVITNTLNGAVFCNPALIDVKPKVTSMAASMDISNYTAWIGYAAAPYWPANGAKFATDGTYKTIPKDSRIQMDMANVANYSAAYPMLWYVYVKNISGATIPWTKFDATGSADSRAGTLADNGTHYFRNGDEIANNARYGSLDPYFSAAAIPPAQHAYPTADASTLGSHGGGYGGLPLYYAELTDVGFVLKINNIYYKYRLMWSSERVSDFVYKSTPTMVLYGMYKTEPAAYAPYTYYTGTGAGSQILPQRTPLVYNP